MSDKPMTVGELIEKLQGFDPNIPVASKHHAACQFYEFDVLLYTLKGSPILMIDPIENSETFYYLNEEGVPE